MIELIQDIYGKILEQAGDLHLIKVSYISSMCLLQILADALLHTMVTKSICMQTDVFKAMESAVMDKEVIFNMVFRDLCACDEVGATLKLQLVTEIFLANDTFKSLDKTQITMVYKILSMTLSESSMRLLLGPRALQSLVLLVTKN